MAESNSDDVTALRSKRAPPESAGPFGCGAVVRLKSGGPAMTVRRGVKCDARQVSVDWFGGEDEWRMADFHVEQLEVWVELAPAPQRDEFEP